MPSVKPGESEQTYVSRCIAELVGNEGYDKEQAAAICHSKFREAKKTIEGMSTTEGLVTTPKCDDCGDECDDKKNKSIPPVIDDGGTDIYGTIRRKTMTPEEAQAAQAGQGQGGGEVPPDAGAGTEEQVSNEPPSVQVSKAVYTSLKNLMGNLKAAENTYENPEAKEYFNGPFAEKCNEAMGEIKGLISKLGSGGGDDFSSSDSGDTEGGEAGAEGEGGEKKKKPTPEEKAAEEEETMKSFLALGQTQDLKLLGIAAPLGAIARAKNLTNEQRLSLNGVLKSIRNLCDDAKKTADANKQKSIAAQVSSLQEIQGGLTKSISALQSSINELLPG